MKEITLRFESEEDYNKFMKIMILDGIESGDTVYDEENKVAIIKKQE